MKRTQEKPFEKENAHRRTNRRVVDAVTEIELPSLPLTLRLFGPLEVLLNGDPLPRLRFRKSSWLLALLALRHGTPVEREWLLGLLWPESPGSQALRNSLTELRRALGGQACRIQSPTPYSLCLDLTGATVDVGTFDQAIARGDPAALEEAVALYRGALLEGCCEEWAFQERQVREQAYLAARERLAALALERGESAAAEQHLRRAVATDPLRESAQRALMQALAAGGNYGAALVAYRELRHHLHRELNAAPDAETQTLFQQLRSEGRRLAAKRAGVRRWAGTHEVGGGVGAAERGAPPDPAPPTPNSHPLTPAPELPAALLREALTRAPLVGREAELAVLDRRLAAAFRGEGGVVLLAGEPGIGKTRLATEACALARQRGVRVLIGHCEEQGAAPYQPIAEALRGYLGSLTPAQAEALLPPPVAGELVRLVPRLAETVREVPPAGAGSGAAARQALVEAMGEFLALLTRQQGPALLLLEDLHWADEGSLAMLHSLARRAAGLPLLIVGTYRDLPPDLQRPLAQTLTALHRERLSERLPLRRLPEAGVEQMVAGLLACPFEHEPERTGEEDEPDAGKAEPLPPATPARAPAPARVPERCVPAAFIAALHQETEGNPFFVEEVLQHLVEEGALSRREGRWHIEAPARFQAPASVQAAIGRRLEHLSAESREALTLAAVIGPQFDFEVLLAASGVEEERLLGWVEEWLGARLVIEEPDRGGSWESGVRSWESGEGRSSLTPNSQLLVGSDIASTTR